MGRAADEEQLGAIISRSQDHGHRRARPSRWRIHTNRCGAPEGERNVIDGRQVGPFVAHGGPWSRSAPVSIPSTQQRSLW